MPASSPARSATGLGGGAPDAPGFNSPSAEERAEGGYDIPLEWPSVPPR
jgi:hypothetical protein